VVEFDYALVPSCRRRGHATNAALALIELARSDTSLAAA
jgi:hypothetical protein